MNDEKFEQFLEVFLQMAEELNEISNNASKIARELMLVRNHLCMSNNSKTRKTKANSNNGNDKK